MRLLILSAAKPGDAKAVLPLRVAQEEEAFNTKVGGAGDNDAFISSPSRSVTPPRYLVHKMIFFWMLVNNLDLPALYSY